MWEHLNLALNLSRLVKGIEWGFDLELRGRKRRKATRWNLGVLRLGEAEGH
jgi:hypothetical protein